MIGSPTQPRSPTIAVGWQGWPSREHAAGGSVLGEGAVDDVLLQAARQRDTLLKRANDVMQVRPPFCVNVFLCQCVRVFTCVHVFLCPSGHARKRRDAGLTSPVRQCVRYGGANVSAYSSM